MKIREQIRIAILVVFLLSSCSQNESKSEVQLSGKTWVLSTYNDTQPIAGHQPVLEFETDQISGTTGCNHYGGTYQIDGESIRFEGIFSTEMACLEPEGLMNQERVYLELLGIADQFELNNGVLTFYAESIPILVFENQSDAPQSTEPAIEPAETVATAADPTPTTTPLFVPPEGFNPYQDPITGITVYIPETWIVTGILEGQYAIMQSYPEDKYVGGEGLETEDTKCDLNIQPSGTSIGGVIQQWRSDGLTTIVSEEEVVLQSGLAGQRLEIESLGGSVAFVTEINNHVVVLNCFGNPKPFEEIVHTLSGFESTATSIPFASEGLTKYRDPLVGVSINIPASWIVTGVIQGEYAIFQSYPEDKYVGGEMREEGDTKCDLNIHPIGTLMDDLINQWKSSDMTTILAEEEFAFPDGVIGKYFEIDSMGQSAVFIAEMNNQAVSLTCFGDFSIAAEIASTLQVLE